MPAAPNAETRELRLAVVLYGGVSLAIYMHGTTKELHGSSRRQRRRRTASDGVQPGPGLRHAAGRHGQRPAQRDQPRVHVRDPHGAPNRSVLPARLRQALPGPAVQARHRPDQPATEGRGPEARRGETSAGRRGASRRDHRALRRPDAQALESRPFRAGREHEDARHRPRRIHRPRRSAGEHAPRHLRGAPHVPRHGCVSPGPARTSHPTSTTSAS